MADGWWRSLARSGEREARALLYRLGPESFTDRVLLAWTRSPESAADDRWRALATLPARWRRAGFSAQGGRLHGAGCRRGRASALRWPPPRRRGSKPVFRSTGDVGGHSRRGRGPRMLDALGAPTGRTCCGFSTTDCALHCGESRAMNTTGRPADIARRSAKALAGRERPRDASGARPLRCRARPRARRRANSSAASRRPPT